MVRDGSERLDFRTFSPRTVVDFHERTPSAANDDDRGGWLGGSPRWLVYLVIIAYCAGVWSGAFWLISILF